MGKNAQLTLSGDQSREGLNFTKIAHTITLPFRPGMTETIVPVAPFLDLNFERIKVMTKGLVLDIDATLIEHHGNDFSPEIIAMLETLRDNFKTCFFSNNNQLRPALMDLDIPFVTNVKPKPHPHGFDTAARHYLGLSPEQCTMIGDNLLTDGGALRAGLNLVLVKPVPGSEGLGHKITRRYGHLIKAFHDRIFSSK